jgi:hypothetical protein
LIFQDEMEIHRHPALTRMWAPVGQQPEVPAPGKNEKQVVYCGVNYTSRGDSPTLATGKCGAAFLIFLIALLKQYVGRHSIPVCDNGRFQKTKAVEQWLAEHRDQITVYWLPPRASTSAKLSGTARRRQPRNARAIGGHVYPFRLRIVSADQRG